MNITSNIVSPSVIRLYETAKKTNTLQQAQDIFKVDNVNSFISKMVNYVDAVDATDYEYGKPIFECRNKMKGDFFELFTVLWLNTFGGDRLLSVSNVKWAQRDQEGFDFLGINKEGNTMTIQSKFLANPKEIFEGDGRLETFFATSLEYSHASPDCPSAVLFTTACKVAERYRRYERRGTLLVIDRQTLAKHSNNNKGFWMYTSSIAQQVFPTPAV